LSGGTRGAAASAALQVGTQQRRQLDHSHERVIAGVIQGQIDMQNRIDRMSAHY
jgi:hypothetical protein